MTLVAVHGIRNRQKTDDPTEAAAMLAAKWTPRLAAGYRDAGLTDPSPSVSAAYYAHLLRDGAQGTAELDHLTPQEQEWAWAWMLQAGIPAETAQGPGTRPLRQGLDWLARRSNVTAEAVGRLMSAFLREVYVYLTRPEVRARCQAVVLDAITANRANVVIAHSLGSVVTYETLCAHPDLEVDLLLTLGSPLALPGVVFEGLVPEPRNGRASRPAGVRRWVNIADPGDLVALPIRLGDKFPVDLHDEAYIGKVASHSLSAYLSCGLVAAALHPYVKPA
ncbi:MAG: hypothetical protein ABW022_06430 [Actinoplanes sp.]